MASLEQVQRISGATLFGIPAFDFFVWALDTYARGDSLMTLHEHLPPVLLNPGIGFICMCGGLGLLYMAHLRHIALSRQQATQILDSSGTAYPLGGKPKWLVPVLIVFCVALLAAPLLSIRNTLAYKGVAPQTPNRPAPPLFAYHKTPLKPLIPKPQAPSVVIAPNAPNGIANAAPNLGNQTVNNMVPRVRVMAKQERRQTRDGWTVIVGIRPTDVVATGIVRLTCSGPVSGGGLSASGQEAIGPSGPDPSDPDTYVLSIEEPETISSERPIVVMVNSKEPITVLAGSIGQRLIEFLDGPIDFLGGSR